uniref:Bestrophin homolog n=1 Tax=Plectus sambesii TaxID=2011161 RepID=A0A914UWT6_9BILA
MTVTYSLEVSTSGFLKFNRLMFRWRGSIWQVIWYELAIWSLCYAAISAVYRFALDDDDRRRFESVATFAEQYTSSLPVTFVLGFYVSIILTRWWNIFLSIPWPDNLGLCIATYIKGHDDNTRIIRRTMIRYLTLAQVLVFRNISSAAKKRFPTIEHLIEAGLMTKADLKVYNRMQSTHPKYWMPLQWITVLLKHAKDEKVLEDAGYGKILDKLLEYRAGLAMLLSYDWISVPLVYTQVVNLAVRFYFAICLVSRQYLEPHVVGDRTLDVKDVEEGNDEPGVAKMDMYIPLFTLLQFIFYLGWLKVAEVLINPLGEDPDDFEINFIIDRNMQIGYAMVDDHCDQMPTLEKDSFWNEREPELPHTQASIMRRENPLRGTCASLKFSKESQRIVPMESIDETAESQGLLKSIRRRLTQKKDPEAEVEGAGRLPRLYSEDKSQIDESVPASLNEINVAEGFTPTTADGRNGSMYRKTDRFNFL